MLSPEESIRLAARKATRERLILISLIRRPMTPAELLEEAGVAMYGPGEDITEAMAAFGRKGLVHMTDGYLHVTPDAIAVLERGRANHREPLEARGVPAIYFPDDAIAELLNRDDAEPTQQRTGPELTSVPAFEGRRDTAADEALRRVEAIFEFRNKVESIGELLKELSHLGLTLADFKANPGGLTLELGIARNIRAACESLNLEVTPQQSLTLAKHFRVGQENYRGGIPLTPHERDIALRLWRIHMQEGCRKAGIPFAKEHEKDCFRTVSFGEHGLTIGHKIGEATGCFQGILVIVSSAIALTLLFAAAWFE